MSGFIEITDKKKRKRLLNIRHIEEVVGIDDNSCYIYLAFSCPEAYQQDYYEVAESYETVKNKIETATLSTVYVRE